MSKENEGKMSFYDRLPLKLAHDDMGYYVIDRHNNVLMTTTSAFYDKLSDEEQDEFYDILKSCLILGNQKNNKFYQVVKSIEDKVEKIEFTLTKIIEIKEQK